MKTISYIQASPSLAGMLSDDQLYFEGIRKPSALFLVRDGRTADEQALEILQKYFNDVYNLLLRKLSVLATEDSTTVEESVKLQALLQEMIKVKGLIEASSKATEEKHITSQK